MQINETFTYKFATKQTVTKEETINWEKKRIWSGKSISDVDPVETFTLITFDKH